MKGPNKQRRQLSTAGKGRYEKKMAKTCNERWWKGHNNAGTIAKRKQFHTQHNMQRKNDIAGKQSDNYGDVIKNRNH